MLDIRTPIGAMFLILGLLLAGYGVTTPAEAYHISLGYNLNLIWGGVMAVFGALMFAWQWLAPHRSKDEPVELSSSIPAEKQHISR